MIYNYLDLIQKSDTSDMTYEEFWKHFEEEQKKIEENWTGWEELD